MKCTQCAKYPFCFKIENIQKGCNEGIKRKIDNEVKRK